MSRKFNFMTVTRKQTHKGVLVQYDYYQSEFDARKCAEIRARNNAVQSAELFKIRYEPMQTFTKESKHL